MLEVCSAVTKYVSRKYLHVPKTIEEMKQKVFQFEAKFGMPRAIGAVDGTHIPIQRPTKISQDVLIKKFYFNFSSSSLSS